MKLKNNSIYGLSSMKNRLNLQGGIPQQDRMIHDKNWSMKHALKYSYQAAKIKKVNDNVIIPCLINPDKTTQNYDEKIISVEWDWGVKAGDVFDWLNTGTKWLVLLQELTELAYFRASIRRCNFLINWQDPDSKEIKSTYVALTGPTETRINSIQKNNKILDVPNYGLSLLVPKTEETLKFFKRYSKFYLKGLDIGADDTCWRIEATDTLSMPGIMQISAVEYYSNKQEDDLEIGVAHLEEIKPPVEGVDRLITGPDTIKPKMTVEYMWRGKNENPNWVYDTSVPIEVKTEGRKIYIKWTCNYKGKFELKCEDSVKVITVDSLF